MISLLAVYLASRRATKKLSFGWYRAGRHIKKKIFLGVLIFYNPFQTVNT